MDMSDWSKLSRRGDNMTSWQRMPHVIALDPQLSSGAVRLYSVILWFEDKYGGMPPHRYMARMTCFSVRCIVRHLVELRREGYITTTKGVPGMPLSYQINSVDQVVDAKRELYGHLWPFTDTPELARSDTPNMACLDTPKMAGLDTPNMACPISSSSVETLTLETLDSKEATVEAVEVVDPLKPQRPLDSHACACEDGTEAKKQRPLTHMQQDIQAAFTAFPLPGVATEPAGTRAKYSRLTGKVKECGLPLVREWATWLQWNPQVVPEGADAWVYFCRRFIDAMDYPWKWQGKGNGNGNGGNGHVFASVAQVTHPAATTQGAGDEFTPPMRYRGPRWKEVGQAMIDHAKYERGTTVEQARAEWDDALVPPDNMEMLNLDGIWGRLRDRYTEERTGILIQRASIEPQFQYDQMAVEYGVEYARQAYWEDHARCTGEYRPSVWVTERLAEKQHEHIGGSR